MYNIYIYIIIIIVCIYIYYYTYVYSFEGLFLLFSPRPRHPNDSPSCCDAEDAGEGSGAPRTEDIREPKLRWLPKGKVWKKKREKIEMAGNSMELMREISLMKLADVSCSKVMKETG
jgi:hypothetical protein